jgi:hypothetical protein
MKATLRGNTCWGNLKPLNRTPLFGWRVSAVPHSRSAPYAHLGHADGDPTGLQDLDIGCRCVLHLSLALSMSGREPLVRRMGFRPVPVAQRSLKSYQG